MAEDVPSPPGRRVPSDFVAERRAATRSETRVIAVLAAVCVPLWAGFDAVLSPGHLGTFALLRALCALAGVGTLVLLRTSLGARRPEVLALALLGAVEVMIAYMVTRVDDAHAAYATGLSLAVYGSAALMSWSWRWTGALVGVTWGALVVTALTAPNGLSRADLTTVGFYLATACLLALVGQWLRFGLARREFESRAALEREQHRSAELLARLERLSAEDELTGLANRRAWDEALRRETAAAARSRRELAVVLCDLDAFKQVNDRFGHPAGDHVLRAVGDLLRDTVRGGDLVARLGGDEFAVLCPHADLETAQALAARLRPRAAELRLPSGAASGITFSIGVAALDEANRNPEDLVARADARLYAAKHARGAEAAGRLHPSPA